MRAGRDRARRRRWASPAGAALVASMALAGACATEADRSPLAEAADGPDGSAEPAAPAAPGGAAPEDATGFQATPGYLETVSEESAAAPHRLEMSMSLRAEGAGPGERIDIEAPVLSGEQDGPRYEMHMDMGQWLREIAVSAGEPRLLPGMDLAIDVAGDDRTLYMRAPFFAQIIEQAPPDTELGPVEELAVLADGWGRIDLTRLGGFSLGELQQTMGGPAGSDPRVLLDIVAGAEDVEDLGAETVGGSMARGLGARLSMADMLAAQGTDPEEFVNQMAGGLGARPGLDARAAAERLLALEIPFEVWVDAEDHVRRVSYEMDMTAFTTGVDAGIGVGGPEELVIGTTMDFSAYGDGSIAIDLPTDAVDITEAYRAMLRADAAAAAAAAGDPQGS